jgi:hypothetical protein
MRLVVLNTPGNWLSRYTECAEGMNSDYRTSRRDVRPALQIAGTGSRLPSEGVPQSLKAAKPSELARRFREIRDGQESVN